jgi:hypothetical protein
MAPIKRKMECEHADKKSFDKTPTTIMDSEIRICPFPSISSYLDSTGRNPSHAMISELLFQFIFLHLPPASPWASSL